MNIKLDENLGNQAIELFKEAGHEVVTVSEQNLGGATDDDLIEACRTEGRVLVTLDLDFSNVLRFPPERYAGIAVLRVPHPIDLDAIREHVRGRLDLRLSSTRRAFSDRDTRLPKLEPRLRHPQHR